MRRSTRIEIFSLSLLDMVFCGMAGVLVLYVIADPDAPTRKSEMPPEAFVTVEWPGSVGQIGYCVSVATPSRVFESRSSRSQHGYLFERDPCVATLTLEQPLEAGATVAVYVDDFDVAVWPPPASIEVLVTLLEPGTLTLKEFPLRLEHANGYHAATPLK